MSVSADGACLLLLGHAVLAVGLGLALLTGLTLRARRELAELRAEHRRRLAELEARHARERVKLARWAFCVRHGRWPLAGELGEGPLEPFDPDALRPGLGPNPLPDVRFDVEGGFRGPG